MIKVKFEEQTELTVKNIKGFMKRKVVVSGTSAKVTCPKEYLGEDAVLVILENEPRRRDEGIEKDSDGIKKDNSSSSD